MPRVLPLQHRTAGVDLGANQGHAGGLTVPRGAILERPKKKVYTHAKGSGQYLGRIRTYNKIRRSAPLSAADTAALMGTQAQSPRSAPLAIFKQARRGRRARTRSRRCWKL